MLQLARAKKYRLAGYAPPSAQVNKHDYRFFFPSNPHQTRVAFIGQKNCLQKAPVMAGAFSFVLCAVYSVKVAQMGRWSDCPLRSVVTLAIEMAREAVMKS